MVHFPSSEAPKEGSWKAGVLKPDLRHRSSKNISIFFFYHPSRQSNQNEPQAKQYFLICLLPPAPMHTVDVSYTQIFPPEQVLSESCIPKNVSMLEATIRQLNTQKQSDNPTRLLIMLAT